MHPYGFLMFSGGREKVHWELWVIGKVSEKIIIDYETILVPSLPFMNTKSDTSCQKLRKSRYLALPNFALFFHFIPNTLP